MGAAGSERAAVAAPPSRDVQGNARRLSASSTFTQLPRPVYEVADHAIRPGIERVLTVAGGLLLAVSAGGAWTRVTELAEGETVSQITEVVLGIDLVTGVPLLLTSLAAVALNRWWQRGRMHTLTAVVTGLAALLGFVQLLVVQSQLTDRAVQSVAAPDFAARNLGLGWGAWAGLAGACLLLVALLFGVLVHREDATDPQPVPTHPGALR